MRNIREDITKLKENLNERQIQLIMHGSIVLFIVIVLLFAHRPLAIRLRKSEKKLRTLTAQLVGQRDAISTLKGIDLAEGLMKQADVSLAIDDITEFGRKLEIKFISITPQEIQHYKDGNFSVLPIAFKIECVYKGLGQFLAYLEEFPRTLAGVGNLSVHPAGALAKLEVEMMVNLYMEAQ